MSSKYCLDKCYKDCFSALDTANIKHQLGIKEYLYITLRNPILNKQKQKQYQYIKQLSFSFIFFALFPYSFYFNVWQLLLIVFIFDNYITKTIM